MCLLSCSNLENEIVDRFPSGKVKTVYERHNDSLGVEKTYYENGQLENEVEYKNGIEEGLARVYYENGKLKISYSHKSGKKHGNIKFYYPTGVLKAEGKYDMGRPLFDKRYNERGELIYHATPDSFILQKETLPKLW